MRKRHRLVDHRVGMAPQCKETECAIHTCDGPARYTAPKHYMCIRFGVMKAFCGPLRTLSFCGGGSHTETVGQTTISRRFHKSALGPNTTHVWGTALGLPEFESPWPHPLLLEGKPMSEASSRTPGGLGTSNLDEAWLLGFGPQAAQVAVGGGGRLVNLQEFANQSFRSHPESWAMMCMSMGHPTLGTKEAHGSDKQCSLSCWPGSVKIGLELADSGRTWSTSAEVAPTLRREIRPKLGQLHPGFNEVSISAQV